MTQVFRMPSSLTRTLALSLALVPLAAAADKSVNLSCNVNVTVDGGTAPETYTRSFTLQQGVAFSDDFSTPTRQRTFDAVVAREAGAYAISINYFNDISTFDAVGFSTRLTLNGNSASTSGTTDYSTSLPSFRRYVTAYTLSCRRV